MRLMSTLYILPMSILMKRKPKECTRVTITLQLYVDDSAVEKLIYNAIEDNDIKALTELVEYCSSINTKIRGTKLESVE